MNDKVDELLRGGAAQKAVEKEAWVCITWVFGLGGSAIWARPAELNLFPFFRLQSKSHCLRSFRSTTRIAAAENHLHLGRIAFSQSVRFHFCEAHTVEGKARCSGP